MPARRIRTASRLILLLTLVGACARTTSAPGAAPGSTTASSSASRAATGQWRSLTSLDNWRGYQGTTVPPMWTVNGNILMKSGVGEDIVSRDTFKDFELEFDWMLNPGGNSGVFYRATEEYNKIYWSAPEYALLDDARHPDGKNVITSAGAAHSLYPAPRGVVKEAGQWNSSRIVVRGTHVEHWLNGQKLFEYEYGSPDFNDRLAKSKFARWPNFAKAPRGLLGIQGDHGGVLSIRDMRIREFR